MLYRNPLIYFLFLLLLLQAFPLSNPLSMAHAQEGLITRIEALYETRSTPLSFAEAKQRFVQGDALSYSTAGLTFGIGTNPVWVRLSVDNQSGGALVRRLTAGVTWINRLDFYHAVEGAVLQQWRGGDGLERTSHLIPGVGLVVDVALPANKSELYIRAESSDPIVLPIKLMTPEQAKDSDLQVNVAYGLLFGFLVALIGYNLMLYVIFRHPRYFLYSTYIGLFVVVNMGYNGYGFAWLYPEYPKFQNYSTISFMVLLGVAGLLFASSFLRLKENMPGGYRYLRAYIIAGPLFMAGCVIAQHQYAADLFSFSYLTVTTLIMVLLGLLNRNRVDGAEFFLLAVTASMVGLLITALSVWGAIPYSDSAYHAAELGVVLEAVLLAVILAKQLRMNESERVSATHLASFDPLTELRNRRSFLELGEKALSTAVRNSRPLTIALLDIDHFKQINDTYGHRTGDEALKHVSRLISNRAREGDIVARWGGEEVVLLLPETDSRQALLLTERLRAEIEASPLNTKKGSIALTVSLGLCERGSNEGLEKLIDAADKQLYLAKQRGRNRVEPQLLDSGGSVPE